MRSPGVTLFLFAWCLCFAANTPAYDADRHGLEPSTGVEAWAGFRYQSGETSSDDRIEVPADGAFAFELYAYREQALLRSLWRGEVEVGIDVYARERSEDYDVFALRFGRVFEAPASWRVYAAVAGEQALFDYDSFYTNGSLWVTAEPVDLQAFRWLHARVGRDEYASEYTGSDAWIADVETGLGFDDLLIEEDGVWIGPAVSYNHAESRRLRFIELDLETEYWLPIGGEWSVSFDVLAWRRFYAGHEENLSDDRRDWYLTAGSSVWLERLFTDALSLECRYEYERNWSNDDFERYESHNPGVYFHFVY